MAEPDESESLQTALDAAEQAGDLGLANELYLRQIGNTDPFGLEPLPVPEVQDQALTEASVPEPVGPLTVATDAADAA